MSNTKEIHIAGTVPYHFLNEMSDPDAARIARMTGPSMGLSIRYSNNSRYVPNTEVGGTGIGQTAVYEFEISGIEALPYKYLDALTDSIVAANGTITSNEVYDLEA
jgi:hypothetical protein|tara:strand:- start:188 stop:505 length:318 start_codon:yes stop_codon:yes gene_type:complete